jgi:hypothetical protein
MYHWQQKSGLKIFSYEDGCRMLLRNDGTCHDKLAVPSELL